MLKKSFLRLNCQFTGLGYPRKLHINSSHLVNFRSFSTPSFVSGRLQPLLNTYYLLKGQMRISGLPPQVGAFRTFRFEYYLSTSDTYFF